MDKKRCQQLQNDFYRTMTQRRVIAPLQRSKGEILQLLDDRVLAEHTYSLVQGRRCEPGMVLVICRRVLECACPEPQGGWIKAIYQYLRGSMYPHLQDASFTACQQAAYLFYIEALEFFLQREREFVPFDPMTDFVFLTPEELIQSGVRAEYERFLEKYRQHHVYAMLRISRVATRFDLLAHVAGVHYVSMHAARSLAKAGIPVDLGLVSGAAAGHDFGKLGCRSSEEQRIPYLHYYYTDIWFREHEMPEIGHVAANHSIWDLELENLPVECILLIYADFRVKRLEGERAQEQMNIYTLSDSYDIILNKLDNVDDAKRLRYRYVYSKLRDFEQFMQARGVRAKLEDDTLETARRPSVALLNEDEAVEHWKYAAIEHNIVLMHRLSRESSFGDMLEAARGEKDWKNLRAYLNIFQEYHSYMTQRQKLMTLMFLYELLMHGEGDIRRQAAALMGVLMVRYDVEYRKELPEDVSPRRDPVNGLSLWKEYSNSILYPDYKIIDRHKSYIRYTLKLVLDSILTHCKPERRRAYLDVFMQLFTAIPEEDAAAFILLDTVQKVPLENCNDDDIRCMAHAMRLLSARNSPEIKAVILRCMKYFYTFLGPDHACLEEVRSIADEMDLQDHVTLIFLRYEIAKLTGAPWEELEAYRQRIIGEGHTISQVCLENLKSATPWVIKEINIDLLLRLIKRDNEGQALLLATHLSNLVKVSEKVVVRHRAGVALVQLAPILPLAQRNEIAIELAKGLETGQYEFSKYIPEYLGQFSLHLHPKELNEFISELEKFIRRGNDHVATVALDTIGVMLQGYLKYQERFQEPDPAFEARLIRLLGLAMCGLSHYHEPVSREAFLVLARQVFASRLLSFQEKARIFSIINKKMLLLISEEQGSELLLFNRAASLNHIYRFITEYTIKIVEFHLATDARTAYFPGTFDPFSLSHKGILREILGLGFEVYLALDEFSWSKKTQPRMLRRKIMAMSTADLFGVYLFPDDLPVNIASIRDLNRLRDIFASKQVHMVVGSDVVLNASSYSAAPMEGSVHHFNHIVFRRNVEEGDGEKQAALMRKRLLGDVIELSLPPYLEEVSSSRIRDNIDLNRDISNLIDPVTQKFIYDYSLYLREAQYKEVLSVAAPRFRFCVPIREEDILCAEHVFSKGLPFSIRQAMHRPGMEMILSFETGESDLPSGFLCFHEISTADLYEEFKDGGLAEYIRANTSGKMVVINALAATNLSVGEEVCQLLLTEALANCLKRDYTYAIYCDARGSITHHVQEVLLRQGFQHAEGFSKGAPVYVVEMKFPITLLHDVEPMIKEPLRSDEGVQLALKSAHERMQNALTQLYPGNLVLSFDSRVMNARLVEIITAINGVPNQKLPVRRLGEAMCVPYGKILQDVVMPNTVTKTLHVEKVFDEQVRSFTITHFPNYSPLKTQVDTIRSFERPLLMVDDLLHKGNRVRELEPLLREDGIQIKKYVCGILTGRGKDLMTIQNHEVESIYFIPNLRIWMSEANMYPFIGGDSAKQSRLDPVGSLHSVNLILPYVMPRFIKGCSQAVLIEFSKACLTNAHEILSALERAYRESFERNLTLGRLGEALVAPRRPDKGDCIEYDGTLAPTIYLRNDMLQLARLNPRIKETEEF